MPSKPRMPNYVWKAMDRTGKPVVRESWAATQRSILNSRSRFDHQGAAPEASSKVMVVIAPPGSNGPTASRSMVSDTT